MTLTVSYPAGPGQPAEGYPAVSRALLRGLSRGIPAAVVQAGSPGGVSYQAAGGWACLTGGPDGPVPATASTLFDLASLTKIVGTLPLVLLLHQRGAWSIDDPIARWLPAAPRSAVTIRHCLTHTAGLVAHRPYFAQCADAAEIRRAVVAELADTGPGPVCYSDLSFMLLGWAAEECAGAPLDTLVAREILAPLGMTSTGYRPAAERTRIAATEADGDQRLRPGLVWGEVHDGNAYALGGVSGHAGLFGTAADLAAFATALLRPASHPVLSAATIAEMTRRQTPAGDDVRALGWRLRPDAWGRWPAGTLWHTGFTGTSLLVAPALDVAVVALTNAVHPVRRTAQLVALRQDLHRAVRTAVRPRGPAAPAATDERDPT